MGNTAFIWDLDGTLLDSYGIITASLYQTLKELGIERDEGSIYKELITYSLGVFLSATEKDTGIDAEIIRKKFAEINEAQALKIKPVRNAPEILAFLKGEGIPNYVYTHKGKSAYAVLKNIGLYGFFEDIITGGDGFPKKPDPAALDFLIEKHGLDRENTLYVGDRTIDMLCAANAGIRGIMYLPEGSPAVPTGKEEYIIGDLMEIRTLKLR